MTAEIIQFVPKANPDREQQAIEIMSFMAPVQITDELSPVIAGLIAETLAEEAEYRAPDGDCA